MEEVIGSIPLGSTILPLSINRRSVADDALGLGRNAQPRRVTVGIVLALACAACHPARAETAPPVEAATPEGLAAALRASLRDRILSAHSATLALESWCAEHDLAADPHLVAFRAPGPDKPLTAVQRARLAIGPDEPVRYRRVRLACGDRTLSEADNWYVPARLTPEMNRTLDETRTPFGRVVSPLRPVRQTVAVRAFPLTATPALDEPLFEVNAVLSTAAGQPFCEVVETYLGGAFPRSSR